MSKNTTKTPELHPDLRDLGNRLRYTRETFIHDDKVIGERLRLQYKYGDSDSGNWFNIETKDEFRKIYNLEDIECYTDTVLRPGVKEQIEELKSEEDDD